MQFLSLGWGYSLFLTSKEAVLSLASPKKTPGEREGIPHREAASPGKGVPDRDSPSAPPAVLRMKLLGASSRPQGVGLEELPVKVNYFLGNDPQKWHTGIPTYARVKYPEVYPDIDLVYYGSQRQLEYDFVVSPGADRLEVDARGDLVVQIAAGQFLTGQTMGTDIGERQNT